MSKSIIDEIENLKQIIENAKRVPFSKFIIVDKDEVLGSIMRIEAMLPEEVKQAVNISKQKDMILQNAYEEKERIIKEAELEFKKLVDESNVLLEARKEREKILKEAKEEAERIRNEALSFAKDVLSKVEAVLEKAQNTIKESKEAIDNENPN